jgi:hypothetical protein
MTLQDISNRHNLLYRQSILIQCFIETLLVFGDEKWLCRGVPSATASVRLGFFVYSELFGTGIPKPVGKKQWMGCLQEIKISSSSSWLWRNTVQRENARDAARDPECMTVSIFVAVALDQVWSFERGCHPKGSMAPYGESVDSVYTTWVCRCSTSFCNNNVGAGTQADCHPAGGTKLRQSNSLLVVQSVAVLALILMAIM